MRTTMIFRSLLSVLAMAGMAYAQVASSSSLTADSYCGSGFCVTALLDSASTMVNYTLVVPSGGSNIGWWSIAQGSQMAGANMAICWVNGDGSLTISHRSSASHQTPTSSAVTVSQFSTNNVGKTTSSLTWWSWNMPLPSGSKSAVQHVFAMNPTGPSSSDPTSSIKKHTKTDEGIVLDLTKAYDGSAPKGISATSKSSTTVSSSTSSNAASSSTNATNPFQSSSSSKSVSKVVILHLLFMVLGWLIIFPAGIFVTRYGRTSFKWFPYHQAVQFVGLLSVLIGFVLAVTYVHSQGDSHFSSTHEVLGLILCIGVLVQVALGLITHQLRNRLGIRAVGYVHIPLGLLIVALSFWEVHLGFEVWDDVNVPNWANFIIYAWAALLVIVYAIGFRKIKQEREMDRKRGQDMTTEKRFDQSYMRSDAVDTYLMTEQQRERPQQHHYQEHNRTHWQHSEDNNNSY